jgi:hypothetical protein
MDWLIGFFKGLFLKFLAGDKTKIVYHRKIMNKPFLYDNTVRVSESKVYSDEEFKLK